jgi:hypothetical protein
VVAVVASVSVSVSVAVAVAIVIVVVVVVVVNVKLVCCDECRGRWRVMWSSRIVGPHLDESRGALLSSHRT